VRLTVAALHHPGRAGRAGQLVADRDTDATFAKIEGNDQVGTGSIAHACPE
jgi:hypothetical protein